MLFNATFNNISVISWWSVLLVEETGITGENHQSVISRNYYQNQDKSPSGLDNLGRFWLCCFGFWAVVDVIVW
jgi:hypothetical protein